MISFFTVVGFFAFVLFVIFAIITIIVWSGQGKGYLSVPIFWVTMTFFAIGILASLLTLAEGARIAYS